MDLIEPVIRDRTSGPVTFYEAYLIYDQNEDKERYSHESQVETFRRTYAGVKLDLVIAVSLPAIEFAVRYRDQIFPRVPIVVCQVEPKEVEGRTWPGVTGITIPVGIRETIDLALRLEPETKAIAIISRTDSFWMRVTHSELLRYRERIKEIDLIGVPSREMLEKTAAFPPQTIVLFQVSPDSMQPEFGNMDLLDAVSLRFPTFSPWELLCLNHGCIGGAYGDHAKQVRATGDIAARVLMGERPEAIPIVHKADVRDTVDWRTLARWQIPESRLAPGTIVLHRDPTLWERGKKYFLLGIAVIALQALLIVGLLWQRARKRTAEAVLRESETRFRVMADTTPALIWMCDARGNMTYVNERWASFTGSETVSAFGGAWIPFVHPDDLKSVLDTFSQAVKRQRAFSIQHRLRHQDGKYRWIFSVASPRVNGDGSFGGFIGSAVDVTDQKLAREALEKVSGQLIDAQEKERSRLSRELHDDICQRLAMLSLRIEKVTKYWGRGKEPATEQLEQIWQQCSNLTADVQALSHELHPSTLDNLGLVAALQSFCRDISEQSGVEAKFVANNIPDSLPRELSLTLFRVVQEAVHNALKYSGEKHFEVHLDGSATQLQLEIRDQGIGFDPTNTNGRGLGLVSMAERIYQVNGTFEIDSYPNAGTCIRVRVPIVAQATSAH